MGNKCDLTCHRAFFGKDSSHANNKTPRVFNLNKCSVRLESKQLRGSFSLNISNKTWRTIKKKGGLDDFLLTTKGRKLSVLGLKLKKKICARLTTKGELKNFLEIVKNRKVAPVN